MHRSLFMWDCQGSGNQLKSNPMPLLSHFLLFKVHDKVGRNSQQHNSVANGMTCCEWKFSSHELTRSFRRPCARITLRSALKPPLIDQRGTTTGRRATLSLSAPSNEVRPHRRSSWVVRRGLVALDCRIPSGKDICTQWRVNSHFSLSTNHLILKVSEGSFVLPVASRPRGRNSQGTGGAKGKSPCYKPWNQLDLSAPFQLGGRISSPCLLS